MEGGAAAANLPVKQVQFTGLDRFVPLARLQHEQELRRLGSGEESAGGSSLYARPRKDFDENSTVFVFVSHRWARPAADGRGHPDDAENHKAGLIVGALEALKNGECVADAVDFAVWVDFCCVDQDGTPATELCDNMPALIASCDMMLTPVIDQEHEVWTRPPTWTDVFQEYGAAAWHKYWTRAWCRVEAMLAAVRPPTSDRNKRALLFRGALAAAISRGRRPHILFGSKELDLGFPPVFLPPLLNATFQRYKPEQGDLTCEEDRQTIGQLTKEARALIKDVVPGWKGVYRGEGDGKGKFVCAPPPNLTSLAHATAPCHWRATLRRAATPPLLARLGSADPDGSVYTGQFKGGVKEGQGTYQFANGSKYVGEWQSGKKHGQGRYEHVNGDAYDGQYVTGKQEGYGTFSHADGEVYEGQWKAGHRAGKGRYIMPDGSVANEGVWRQSYFVGAEASQSHSGPSSSTIVQRRQDRVSVQISPEEKRTGDPAAEPDTMPCSVHHEHGHDGNGDDVTA